MDIEEQEQPTGYSRKVGDRLRAIRRQKRLSLQEVEATSEQEFKASVLGAYERGERAISVPRLQRLARFYNGPVDQLLPRDLASDDDEVLDLETGASARRVDVEDEKIRIDLARLESIEAPEREMLTRYLGMIQVQRQDFNGRVITIRYEDLRAIACLFETSIDAMRRRLDELELRLPTT